MTERDLLSQQRHALTAFLQAESKRATAEKTLVDTKSAELSRIDSLSRSNKATADALLQKSRGNLEEVKLSLTSINLDHLLTNLPEFSENRASSSDALEELRKQTSVVEMAYGAINFALSGLKQNEARRAALRHRVIAIGVIAGFAIALASMIYYLSSQVPQGAGAEEQPEVSSVEDGESKGVGATSSEETSNSQVVSDSTRTPTRTPCPKVATEFLATWEKLGDLGKPVTQGLPVPVIEQAIEQGLIFVRDDTSTAYFLINNGNVKYYRQSDWAALEAQPDNSEQPLHIIFTKLQRRNKDIGPALAPFNEYDAFIQDFESGMLYQSQKYGLYVVYNQNNRPTRWIHTDSNSDVQASVKKPTNSATPTSTLQPTQIPARETKIITYTLTPTKPNQLSSDDTAIIEAVSSPKPVEISALDLEWIFIPAGNFTMGSREEHIQQTLAECNDTEGEETGQWCQASWFKEPLRSVFIDNFEITKYEITNAQYKVCVNAGNCRDANRQVNGNNPPYDPNYFTDNYPVVMVSWEDAQTFCKQLNGRLPTEEEWEKAARGTDERRYPWGNTFESTKANLSSSFPASVGSFPQGASPYGIMDMAGNVFEWTATQGTTGYIVRGGGWSKYYFRGRVTDRGTQLEASFSNYDVGFRCVRSP